MDGREAVKGVRAGFGEGPREEASQTGGPQGRAFGWKSSDEGNRPQGQTAGPLAPVPTMVPALSRVGSCQVGVRVWEGAGWGAGQAEERPGPRVPSPWGVKAHLPAPALQEARSSSQLPGNPTPATQVGLPPPSPAPGAPVTCPRGDMRPSAHPPTRAPPPASWAPAPGRQGGTRGEPELGGGAPGRASASSRLASRTQSPLCKDQPSVPGPSLVGCGPSGPVPIEQEAPWPGASGLPARRT